MESQSSIEEVLSLDESAAIGLDTSSGHHSVVPLSKKALHQRDADENLFLRFLELDPPLDPNAPAVSAAGATAGTATAATSTAQAASASAAQAAATAQTIAALSLDTRRKSTYRPISGRTPFTMTKKLVRSQDRGYGFSIVWTHPPRIEKVEKGLSADQAGIAAGDFVIFVDKHNVVTMPEIDILNLIRSQGNTLVIEIFRRPAQQLQHQRLAAVAGVAATGTANGSASAGPGSNGSAGIALRRSSITFCNNQQMLEQAQASAGKQFQPQPPPPPQSSEPRPSTACSNDRSYSVENTKRSLKLPQVTFSKESIGGPATIEEPARRFLYQLINREQHFVSALQFGMQRFTMALQERTDLISPNDHRTLFQNIDEILRLSEDIMEQLVTGDHDPQVQFASRVYLSKSTALCAAYKRYCNGLKRADCVLVNKSRNLQSDFVTFINLPPVPRKRPDLTSYIHKPLQHFREVLKFNLMITAHCRADSEEFRNFNKVIQALQLAYREITVGEGLMEPLGEGRPLLSLQDLEARMVFTKCKPFVLTIPGRQWIFGGDLSRVEGRSVKPYWTLLFSDIIVFAKVSRDRVLFITEEPILLTHVVDITFNIRKKSTEFRLTIDPNGRTAESPTAYCAPDLSRTPKKNSRRYVIVLRSPSPELKAVWQNLLQRQIFLVNATLGSTLNSPLESPDIMQSFLPLCEVVAKNSSLASIKLSSADSINVRNQQKLSKVSKQIEEIIDEKCRFLNKTGTSKGSAIHLAQWMKGQLDAASQPHADVDPETNGDDGEQPIEEWSPDQLNERSKALQLIDENGSVNGRRAESIVPDRHGESRMEEVQISELELDETKSASKSTTSDSQITVRSSPITNPHSDQLSVCRHCHKHCKSKQMHASVSLSNSLKVQHSQASTPNGRRCCQSLSGSEPSMTRGQTCRNGHGTDSTSKSNSQSCGSSSSSSSSSVASQTSQLSSQPSTLTGSCTMNAQLITESESGATTVSRSQRSGETVSLSASTSESRPQFRPDVPGSVHGNVESRKPVPERRITSNGSAGSGGSSGRNPAFGDRPCTCRCDPRDFHTHQLRHEHELRKETCKIVDSVTDLYRQSVPSKATTSQQAATSSTIISHKNCKCNCGKSAAPTTAPPKPLRHIASGAVSRTPRAPATETPPSTQGADDDDWSLMLIGLAQLHPASQLVQMDPFKALPSIAVVPPTPEGLFTQFCGSPQWGDGQPPPSLADPPASVTDHTPTPPALAKAANSPASASTSTAVAEASSSATAAPHPDVQSPEDSPQDEEPPYRSLNTSLKRYGTMSSLERFSSEDVDEKTYNSSEEDANEADNVKIITKEVFCNGDATNWTNRAGTFLEQSRAFLDSYLSRWDRGAEESVDDGGELMDECTSGATSGEDVWGTPTSGENDEMQMFNSDHTNSSPTKSSSSLTGDDDTELMMDELLMAPPMTASSIRGLLPRRRLEPLFEEDTESGESDDEKPAADCSSSDQGQVRKTCTPSGRVFATDRQIASAPWSMPPLSRTVISAPAWPPPAMPPPSLPPPELPELPQPPPPPPAAAAVPMSSTSPAVPPAVPPRQQLPAPASAPAASIAPGAALALATTRCPVPPLRIRRTTAALCTAPPAKSCGSVADTCSTPVPTPGEAKKSAANIARADGTSSASVAQRQQPQPPGQPAAAERPPRTGASNASTASPSVSAIGNRIPAVNVPAAAGTSSATIKQQQEEQQPDCTTPVTSIPTPAPIPAASGALGMSPRLEMRLALNNDIMGDEDLICYDPGPDLATVLGHDLSTFHRFTGRDLISRTASRVQPKEACISFSQQRNSKMDTPTPSRRKPSPSTWSSSASADPVSEENLSDLERLARQEMRYCTSQLRKCPAAAAAHPFTSPTTSSSRADASLLRSKSKFLLSRKSFSESVHRNGCVQQSAPADPAATELAASTATATVPPSRNDYDKILDRRFWKQLTKRRRSGTGSDISAIVS